MADSRPARPQRRARVQHVERLTDKLVRIVFDGPGLEGFAVGAFTDHYVKLLLPPPGADYAEPFEAEEVKARLPREQWPRTRTYTVQDWDGERLTIDFVVHGDVGVAGPWALDAQPGDELQLSGPGGAYAPDPAAAWHLMVGDESVLPAISASLRQVPAGIPVIVVVEVDGPADELPLTTPGDLRLGWVHRSSAGADGLAQAVERLAFPEGRPHAFVHGEAASVRAIRRHLLVDRGLDQADLSASGYWKQTRTEEGWREDKAEWVREAEADLTRA